MSTANAQTGFEYAQVVGSKLGIQASQIVEEAVDVSPCRGVASGWIDLVLQEFSAVDMANQCQIWHDTSREEFPFL